MSKVAHYLQEHLAGEVYTNPDMRRYFSTDGSIFTVTPAIIMYPRNENDVRKVARFTWQLADRGRVIPITARGLGTDQSGAALGSGVVVVFAAHMNRILELDAKTGVIVVEPGINYDKLQQALHTHGRFIPSFPSSVELSTIGGAIANNTAGQKSLRYGSTEEYVKELRIVLANGEIIESRRLNKREVSKKMGLATFEGEIYRALDALFEENQDIIMAMRRNVASNAAGYNLPEVKHKDGSFDLTPLFVGSQGTLGIVTEAMLTTVPYNPGTTLLAVFFDDIRVAEEVILELRKLPDPPCSIEMIDDNLLNFLDRYSPNQLKDVINKPFRKLVVLVEFDNANERVQKRMMKKTTKMLNHYQVSFQVEIEQHKKEQLWKIRESVSTMLVHNDGNTQVLPVINDGIVPIDHFDEYLNGIYALINKYQLRAAVWGHAGTANLHIQPLLDLSQVGDRQKVFRISQEYYDMVIKLGGSISGQDSDGRLRGPYLKQQYGADAYVLLQKVKHIFDPYGTLNPGVKIDVSVDDVKPLLRHEYSVARLYDHLPHS